MLSLILALMFRCLIGRVTVDAAFPVATPVSEIAFEGVSVLFNCSVQGKQAGQTVHWIRDNSVFAIEYNVFDTTRFTDVDRISIHGDTVDGISSYNFKIAGVLQSDAASYQCGLADGTSYLFVSTAASLTVIVGPDCAAGDSNVTEGQRVTLTCQATRSDPPVSLSWTMAPSGQTDTQVWSDAAKVYNRLYWTPSREDQGTVFMCETRHPTREASKACSLGPFDIRYGPVVDVTPSTHTITELGQTITFHCNVDSNPLADAFTWTFNNETVQTASDRFTLVNGGQTLHILNIDSDSYDNAVVACSAHNTVGSGRDQSYLYVDFMITSPVYDDGHTSAETVKRTPILTTTDNDFSHTVGGTTADDSSSKLSRSNIAIAAGSATTVLFLTVSVSILIAYSVKARHRKANRKARQNRYGEGFDLGHRSVVNPIANVDDEGDGESSNITEYATVNGIDNIVVTNGLNAFDSDTNRTQSNLTGHKSSGGTPSHYDVPRKKCVASHYDIPRKPASVAEGASPNLNQGNGRVAENQYENMSSALHGNKHSDQKDISERKNVEGLVYADLEFAKPSDKGVESEAFPKYENTVYAQIQMKK